MRMSRIEWLRFIAVAVGTSAVLLAGALFLLSTSVEGQYPQASHATMHSEADLTSTYRITPSEMTLTGDVAVCDGVITDTTVASWCDRVPAGIIMLGVDPTSPNPSDWDGGRAATSLYIGDVVSPALFHRLCPLPPRCPMST